MNQLPGTCLIAFLLFLPACAEKKAETTTETRTAHHDEGEVTVVSLTQEQIKMAGIETGALQQKDLAATVQVNGTLAVPAQNKAVATSLYGGILQSLLIHPGSQVRKGQTVGTITNTELTEVQQNLISVNAQLKLAELEYHRQQELVAGNAAPLRNLQKAQAELTSLRGQQSALRRQLITLGISPSTVAAGNISSTLIIRAPISGTISDIHAQIGSKVDASSPIAEIVNNSSLHLDLFVFEKDLPLIRPGQLIHFTLTNNPGREYDARIFSIGTAFADASKSIPVHAEVMGDKTGLIEGMSVTALISIGSKTALAIPTEAIVSDGGKDYIFVQTDKRREQHGHVKEREHAETDGHQAAATGPMRYFERVQVIRGASDLGYTEIQPVTGLPANASVIFKGAFFVMAKMTNTGEHEH